MHGPNDPTLRWAPRWGPSIRLIDDVLNTIPLTRIRKRRRWRTARDEVVRLWEQAGIKFNVEVGPGAYDSDFPLAIAGAVRLVRNLDDPHEDFAFYYSPEDAAIAAFKLTDWFMGEMWRETDTPVRVRVIAHEIGHCLGLGHGGTLVGDGEEWAGVMNGGPKPNNHDLESVRSYYLAS